MVSARRGTSVARSSGMNKLALSIATVAGCATANTGTKPATDDGGTSTANVVTAPPDREPPTLLALHMRDRFSDLRWIERHLVDGELDEARDYAIKLAFDKDDAELGAWVDLLAKMRAAASALGTAGDLDDACRAEPRLAATCGHCHVATGTTPELVAVPLPDDDGTAFGRMARHQWAADRLWEAMIAPSDAAWREGLAVLAATPLPAAKLTTVAPESTHRKIAELGDRLQRYAKASRGAGSLDQRATEYGEILVVCAGCHALAR
jgi:cytochrome c553